METRPTKEQISRVMASLGKVGGKARVPKGLSSATPKRRREISAMGVAARRAKRGKNAD